ncbi:MAG: hypothetical protein OXB95_05230, partial [Rhodobacteraceae bacterium]|nr:hypothetical protein [Paracoccaceae bacterium]
MNTAFMPRIIKIQNKQPKATPQPLAMSNSESSPACFDGAALLGWAEVDLTDALAACFLFFFFLLGTLVT